MKKIRDIDQLLQREITASVLPSVFFDGENSLKNTFDIAKKQQKKSNDFFVNICYELANKISACYGNPLDFILKHFPVISSFKSPRNK